MRSSISSTSYTERKVTPQRWTGRRLPFLDLVHLRERRCEQCDAILAEPGSRSFIVDAAGLPVSFSEDETPDGMSVRLICPNGHETVLGVPGDVSAEAAMMTPDDAPIATDAILVDAS